MNEVIPQIPGYQRKLEHLEEVGRESQKNGPPEASWYGLWNEIAFKLSFGSPSVMVVPQQPFRTVTAGVERDKSTRYTDIGIITAQVSEPTELRGAPERKLIFKTVALIEVKPLHGPNDNMNSEDNQNVISVKLREAKASLVDQAVHLFASKNFREGTQNLKIIGIAAAGPYYQWFTFTSRMVTGESTSAGDFSTYLKTHDPSLFLNIIHGTPNVEGDPHQRFRVYDVVRNNGQMDFLEERIKEMAFD